MPAGRPIEGDPVLLALFERRIERMLRSRPMTPLALRCLSNEFRRDHNHKWRAPKLKKPSTAVKQLWSEIRPAV